MESSSAGERPLVRAELRSLDTADSADGSVASLQPDDVERFSFGITASIGPAGDRGEELFQFTVCSPKWLAEQPPAAKGFAFGRVLLLDRWDHEVVGRAIRDLCRRAEGRD